MSASRPGNEAIAHCAPEAAGEHSDQALDLGRVVDVRRESELLLCCARTQMDTRHTTRVRALLQQDMDWDCLLQMADAHGVTSLLYWNLHAICPNAVPQAILDQLRGSFSDNAQSNLFRTQELVKVLALLSAHGILAVPLKGPVLAVSIYGNLALRQFSDLDILVRSQDALQARDLILSHGYRLRAEWNGAPGLVGLWSHHEFPLSRDDGRVVVDLQWHIPSDWRTIRAFPLDAGSLWERLETFVFAGTTVSTFAPEDMMLILCVHGASHGWAELRLVCDVAELIRCNPNMDLGRTLARADALGVARMVLLGLFLAKDLLGAVLPAHVFCRVQADPVVRPLALQVREWMFGEEDKHYLSRRLREAFFSIRLRERLRDKIPYVFYLLDYPCRHVTAWLRARHSVT